MKPFSRTVRLVGSVVITIVVLSLTNVAQAKQEKPLLSGASTEMIVYTCVGCHGQKGISNGPSIPSIGGTSAAYLIETMEGYKSGEIPSTIMGRLAQGYTKKEIKQMGKYFSSQKFVAAVQTSDAKKAKKGVAIHDDYCEKCHSDGGTSVDDESGILKGQWRPYISAQLMDYQNKDRIASKKMGKKLKTMYKKHGDAGIEALLEYYSSDL
jgi:sulfide dehydrogenase cytochrome subunit